MKKLLMFLLSLSILFACNNDKKGVRGFGELEGGGDGDGGWTTKIKNKYLKDCMEESGENQKLAKQICPCVLEKVVKKYTVEEAEGLSRATGEKMARDCMKSGGGDEDEGYGEEGDEEGGNGFKKKKFDDEEGDIDEGSGGARWTNQQRNTYISECATAAETSLGFSSEQANSFCDCMTRKVEKKHSYKVASRMTANDFSTQEWENARAACKSDN